MNNLQKIKEAHEMKLERMKLQADLDIEKNKLRNKLELNKLESENEQLGTKSKIFNLKNAVKKDTTTIKSGYQLKFWAILVTFISTALTVAGGYTTFEKNIFTLISFVFAVIALQFTVYLISAQETRIRQKFVVHFNKIIILKYLLLAVSIYNNYQFFYIEASTIASKAITLALCVGLDLICIFLVGLAYDQITLNFTLSKEKKSSSLFTKILSNLTYSQIAKIENKYNSNKSQTLVLDKSTATLLESPKADNLVISENEIKNVVLDKPRTPKLSLVKNNNVVYKTIQAKQNGKKLVLDKPTKILLNAIYKNVIGENICISNDKLVEITGLKRTEIIKIKNNLNTYKILESRRNKTIILDFNVLK